MTVPLTDEELGELREWAKFLDEPWVERGFVKRLLDEHESLCDAHAKLAVDHLVESEAAARRLELLREMQWCWEPHGGGACPICNRFDDDGHAPDCRLAKELDDA
jgi:hypothetical protein